MRERLFWMLGGGLVTVVLALAIGARPVAGDRPPHVEAGKAIYGLELDRPVAQVLPGTGPITPIKILGNQGNWFLVETPNQRHGPQWVNFDHVVTYRTDP